MQLHVIATQKELFLSHLQLRQRRALTSIAPLLNIVYSNQYMGIHICPRIFCDFAAVCYL
jgi:hypothetical protein